MNNVELLNTIKLYEKLVLNESVSEEFIKDFSYKIIGILRTMDNGDIVALTFPGRKMLGMYIKAEDRTIELNSRKSIGRGNQIMRFIQTK